MKKRKSIKPSKNVFCNKDGCWCKEENEAYYCSNYTSYIRFLSKVDI